VSVDWEGKKRRWGIVRRARILGMLTWPTTGVEPQAPQCLLTHQCCCCYCCRHSRLVLLAVNCCTRPCLECGCASPPAYYWPTCTHSSMPVLLVVAALLYVVQSPKGHPHQPCRHLPVPVLLLVPILVSVPARGGAGAGPVLVATTRPTQQHSTAQHSTAQHSMTVSVYTGSPWGYD